MEYLLVFIGGVVCGGGIMILNFVNAVENDEED